MWCDSYQFQVLFCFCLLGVLNLKEVKKVTYQARSKWFHLGIELDIDIDKLKVSGNAAPYSCKNSFHIHRPSKKTRIMWLMIASLRCSLTGSKAPALPHRGQA